MYGRRRYHCPGNSAVDPDTTCFSFIGDSTFFASGITGVVNAVYNQSDIILIVLDNSTTAMTGHQPHPGTGQTMMGTISEKISIEKILTAIGVTSVQTVDPLNYKAAVKAVADAAKEKGVRAIIFRSPVSRWSNRKNRWLSTGKNVWDVKNVSGI